MKPLLRSKTVIFSALAIAAKLLGFKAGDAQNAYDILLVLWPILGGMVADVGAMVARAKQAEFSANWRSPAFWLTVVSGLCTLASAFGIDLSALQGVLKQGLDNGPAFGALAASFAAMWSAFSANQRVEPLVKK